MTGYPSAVSSLISPLSMRPINGTKHNDEASGTFPGQDFLRRICEAEKEQERAERLKEQNFSKSPPQRVNGSGPSPMDTDFESLPDYAPPLRTLHGEDAERLFQIDTPFSQGIDLSADPDRHLLHRAEIVLAQKLRLTCASYLCTKRRIFKGLVESLQEGKEYKKSYAQNACKVDARKTRTLFTAFESIGWFEPKYFTKYAPNAKLGTGEMSDSELSFVDEQAVAGEASKNLGSERKDKPPQQPAAAAQSNLLHPPPAINGTTPLTNGDHPPSSSTSSSKRKQSQPTQILHPSTSFTPVNDLSLPRAVSPQPHTPAAAATPAAATPSGPASMHPSSSASAPEPNQAHKYSAPPTPTREAIAADSPETYQWRKTASGKKVQVPICPYPRTWPEADTVDRELVRLKRREGKQWEELFEWWRLQGRKSLKNSSCLAVRYSILKKHFEEAWVGEGM